jgi:hypothetical protein
MKKKYKGGAERTAAYRERLAAKKEAAAQQADEHAEYKRLNLCSFAETGFETPAQICQEEIQVHRSWLRALEQPDVLPGETLRQLAKRTWDALLNSKRFGVHTDGGGKWIDTESGKQWVRGFDVWFPLFEPGKQHFQIPFDSKRFPGGPFGETIYGAAKPDWFDTHWIPPSDCTGDEPIDTESLPGLPPVPIKATKPAPKVKPSPRVPPPTVDAPPTVTGYETPLEEQNKLDGFGTFGMTRASHFLAFSDGRNSLQPGDAVTFRIDGMRAKDIRKEIPAD